MLKLKRGILGSIIQVSLLTCVLNLATFTPSHAVTRAELQEIFVGEPTQFGKLFHWFEQNTELTALVARLNSRYSNNVPSLIRVCTPADELHGRVVQYHHPRVVVRSLYPTTALQNALETNVQSLMRNAFESRRFVLDTHEEIWIVSERPSVCIKSGVMMLTAYGDLVHRLIWLAHYNPFNRIDLLAMPTVEEFMDQHITQEGGALQLTITRVRAERQLLGTLANLDGNADAGVTAMPEQVQFDSPLYRYFDRDGVIINRNGLIEYLRINTRPSLIRLFEENQQRQQQQERRLRNLLQVEQIPYAEANVGQGGRHLVFYQTLRGRLTVAINDLDARECTWARQLNQPTPDRCR